MSRRITFTARGLCVIGLIVVGTLAGCREELPPLQEVVRGESEPVTVETSGVPSVRGSVPSAPRATGGTGLLARVDRLLNQQLHGRILSVQQQGAWQVLHGVLAYQDRFPVVVDAAGTQRGAIEYLLDGGQLNGWTFTAGDQNPQTGRRGVRAVVEPGTKTGQGHHDQWLAILAQCDLPIDTPMHLAAGDFQLSDLVWQVQQDVPRNVQREFSWTLIGLTKYLPTDTQWVAADGRQWSIEQLLAAELEQQVDGSACGGTHRLIGITMAWNRHVAQGLPANGVWSDATVLLDNYVTRAEQLQNANGYFSTRFFVRPSGSWDVGSNLAASGHVLEFLSLALPTSRLREPWMERAVEQLCTLLESTAAQDLECGALYHALHGLVLYRQRTQA